MTMTMTTVGDSIRASMKVPLENYDAEGWGNERLTEIFAKIHEIDTEATPLMAALSDDQLDRKAPISRAENEGLLTAQFQIMALLDDAEVQITGMKETIDMERDGACFFHGPEYHATEIFTKWRDFWVEGEPNPDGSF